MSDEPGETAALQLQTAEILALAARWAADTVAELLIAQPDLSGQEVLSLLREKAAAATAAKQRATESLVEQAACRNCHQPISRIGSATRWRHTDAALSRGCRAASFTPDSGWDDTLDKAWLARP